MKYVRMPIEIESPEQMGYDSIKYNLTESSFRDARLSDLDIDLKSLLLCYGDHLGLKELREWIAREEKVQPDDVCLTVGAASALFIVATSLLKKGDRLLVLRPNYATNIETPRAIGAEIDFMDLKFEDGFKVDVDRLISMMRPETKLVSITTPHNPTGVVIPPADVARIAQATAERGITLLVDETYRDMNFDGVPPSACLLGKHVITVSSLSKTYGLPGIRMGWLINQDPKLMELFLAAKEQIFITGSIVDETIALRYLENRARYVKPILARMREHFEIVKKWMATESRLEWVEPTGGVVCFPRIKDPKKVSVDKFYEILGGKMKAYVGPGHWFEQDRRYMRIGYGWPTTEELQGGLAAVSQALQEAEH